jgi:hypothetical protein
MRTGLIDGLTGAAIGDPTVTDESALDGEGKAEQAAAIHAKITLAKPSREQRNQTTAVCSTPD